MLCIICVCVMYVCVCVCVFVSTLSNDQTGLMLLFCPQVRVRANPAKLFMLFCFFISIISFDLGGFPSWLSCKQSPCNAGDAVWISGLGDPLEEEMATYSSSLAREIPWTEEPGGLQSMGSQRVGHNWSDLTCI